MKASCGVPKFLTKIWSLVEDPINSDYICWSQDGNSFIVLDEESFAKEILPKHFKHNNMASFVRQLNWYGFHKVMQDESGAARHDKYCSGRYQHEFFKRGQEELLTKIKRKVTSSTGDKRVFRKAKVSVPRIEEGKTGPDDMQKILTFLHQLQARQDVLDSTVESLKRENEALWKEVIQLRPTQSQFEAVSADQAYDHMASLQSNQPLMIDCSGNYNELSVKTAQNLNQVFDTRSPSAADRKCNRGIKRAMKEDLDSSAEDHSSHVLSIQLPQEYEPYQTDQSEEPSDVSSCESETMSKADTTSNHNVSFGKLPVNFSSLTHNRTRVRLKRFKSSSGRSASATNHRMDCHYSGSETEDNKNCCVESEKTLKTCRSSCSRTSHMLKQIHRDNTRLNERVLAVEQRSLQKLSEISTVLSTLTNYIMNTHNLQSLSCAPLLGSTRLHQKERHSSQNHHQGQWPESTPNYSAKREYDS